MYGFLAERTLCSYSNRPAGSSRDVVQPADPHCHNKPRTTIHDRRRRVSCAIDRLRLVTDLIWETDVLGALLSLLAGAALAGCALLLLRLPNYGVRRALSRTAKDVAVLGAIAVILAPTLLTPFGSGPTNVRLLPFENLIDALQGDGGVRHAVGQIVANTVLFVPLGLSLRWHSWELSPRRAGMVGLGLSASIELLQALTGGGRWVETTDVITNCAGAVLGAAIAQGPAVLYRRQ